MDRNCLRECFPALRAFQVAERFQALVHVFRGEHALAADLADADFAAWCAQTPQPTRQERS